MPTPPVPPGGNTPLTGITPIVPIGELGPGLTGPGLPNTGSFVPQNYYPPGTVPVPGFQIGHGGYGMVPNYTGSDLVLPPGAVVPSGWMMTPNGTVVPRPSGGIVPQGGHGTYLVPNGPGQQIVPPRPVYPVAPPRPGSYVVPPRPGPRPGGINPLVLLGFAIDNWNMANQNWDHQENTWVYQGNGTWQNGDGDTAVLKPGVAAIDPPPGTTITGQGGIFPFTGDYDQVQGVGWGEPGVFELPGAPEWWEYAETEQTYMWDADEGAGTVSVTVPDAPPQSM